MSIPWLASVLRNAGCAVIEEGAWQNRTRSGTFAPIGVLWHHTAGARSSTSNPAPSLSIVINGRSDLPGPLAHALIDFNGTFRVVAGGRANHAGKTRVSGPIPAGDGNALLIGWEIDYAAQLGQPISQAQYDAGVRGTAAVLRYLGRGETFARGHRETSTTGKIDPSSVNLDSMRAAVRAVLLGSATNGVKFWQDLAAVPTGGGYWLLSREGGVETHGSAPFYGASAVSGSTYTSRVALGPNPAGPGYYILAADGGITSCSAAFYGARTGQSGAPYVDMAVTNNGRGYWLLGAGGGVYTFGDAQFFGTPTIATGDKAVSISADPRSGGYWILTGQGGVFAFGGAPYLGGRTAAPGSFDSLTAVPGGGGYWLSGLNGSIFTHGNAQFSGVATLAAGDRIEGMAADPDGLGYWLLGGQGGVFGFDAVGYGRGAERLD